MSAIKGTAAILAMLAMAWPSAALAHASEGAFVLLLPTAHYRAAGIAAVIVTLVLLAIPSFGAAIGTNWPSRSLGRLPGRRLRCWTGSVGFLLLAALVHAGFVGATDPLANPLVTAVWVLWWIVLLLAQALVGNLWRWLDPWRVPYMAMRRMLGIGPVLRLPRAVGAAPAIVLFVLFMLFMTGDPAPYDPRRLALVVSAYWLASLAGMLLFGRRAWMGQCEFVTIAMERFAALAPLCLSGRGLRIGLPGWQILRARQASPSLGLFVLVMLGAGAFESLHLTFWWLARIGVNPLEFPGRSALVGQTTLGMLDILAVVIVAFAVAIAAGQVLAGNAGRIGEAFRRQAQCTLPIVVAYHLAHYLTALLVDGQHLVAALSDPYATGVDYLALGHFHVTTGFLHTRQGMQVIWLAQAGAIVLGHVLAIVLSHAVALDMHGGHRRALVGQLPVSAFMVAYTMFGLWLLAAPTAV